ncbi:hypothetical protein AVEN_7354-1 [Araneus ventricosus]|uniref:Uncharacterized protein n=1 Tax=Araneus ventricosus TaxID=182803 RepID=A0A4Y2BQ93_ARAVE|nr:hypothetical protein AVEN_7354-1 [Araneus ventricosus]
MTSDLKSQHSKLPHHSSLTINDGFSIRHAHTRNGLIMASSLEHEIFVPGSKDTAKGRDGLVLAGKLPFDSRDTILHMHNNNHSRR